VIEEKENVLLERKEVKLIFDHEKKPTPSVSEVVKVLSERYGVPETHIDLKYILGIKGKGESLVKAMIYNKPVKKKEEKKTEEAKTEEKKEEKTEEKEEGGKSETQNGKSE